MIDEDDDKKLDELFSKAEKSVKETDLLIDKWYKNATKQSFDKSFPGLKYSEN